MSRGYHNLVVDAETTRVEDFHPFYGRQVSMRSVKALVLSMYQITVADRAAVLGRAGFQCEDRYGRTTLAINI